MIFLSAQYFPRPFKLNVNKIVKHITFRPFVFSYGKSLNSVNQMTNFLYLPKSFLTLLYVSLCVYILQNMKNGWRLRAYLTCCLSVRNFEFSRVCRNWARSYITLADTTSGFVNFNIKIECRLSFFIPCDYYMCWNLLSIYDHV